MRGFLSFSLLMALIVSLPLTMDAQRRRTVVVRRGPVVRSHIVVRPGHPIVRSVNRSVVVRTMRNPVFVTAPRVFLPVWRWTPVAVTLPPPSRLQWQDTETIAEEEEWVDCSFGVDRRGDALYLDVDGRAQLDFAEVTFANGNVQVVDFEEKTHDKGLYRLLDFSDGREVKTVRLLAKSKSEETKFTVYLKS